MVKMISLVCPNCGAKLDVKNGTQTCFCTYCGTKILISDDNNKTYTKNVNVNQTSYDRTEIEKIKLEHEWEEHKWKREWKEIGISFVIVIAMWLGLFLLVKFSSP